jgi:uncharacterized protein (DUF433 family)
MNSLEQVERLLTTLTPGEKARLVQTLVRDLGNAFAGIDRQPDVCGGDPCIVRTRIPVWVLEQARQQGISEAELLKSYPTLKAEDLTNAWAYARAHFTEINAQIAQNEAA